MWKWFARLLWRIRHPSASLSELLWLRGITPVTVPIAKAIDIYKEAGIEPPEQWHRQLAQGEDFITTHPRHFPDWL